MVRVTLAQMRRSVPRLVAAGLAIAIGTAFVATTLLAGGVLSRTGRDAVTAQLASADVVVGSPTGGSTSGPVTDEDLAAVRALPGVAAADVLSPLGVQLRAGSRDRWQTMLPAVGDPRLTALVTVSGRQPAAAGEVALPERLAADLGVGLDGTVTAVWQEPPAGGGDGTWTDRTQDLTVVGLLADPHHAWTAVGGAGVVTLADALAWSGATSLGGLGQAQLLVAGTPGTTPQALRDEIATALPGVDVMTRDEAADRALDQLGEGGSTALVGVVLGFAAIALVVAGLVIANTFQVLVAQRTRTLALLRAVGARRSQLRGSVLLEATILGLVTSALGAVGGIALAQGMLAILGRANVDVALPSTVQVTWPVLVVPLVVGTAVTTLASLVPARAATRVTPIEALRPLDAPVRAGAGTVRAVVALVMTVLGLAGLAGAAYWGTHDEHAQMLPLALGVLTGALSFVGILLGAVFWVPPLVSLAQRALTRLGPVARLAAANTVRNPRRTAATSTALVIGVTLVALMSTGAASARASLADTLDEHYPVDLTVTPTGATAALPDGLQQTVTDIAGVARVAALRSSQVRLVQDGKATQLVARALAPDEAAAVLRDPALARSLADDAVLVPDRVTSARATAQVAKVTDDAATGTGIELRTVPTAGIDSLLLTPATLQLIDPDASTDTLYVSLDRGADAVEVLRQVQDAVGTAQLQVQGPGAERAQYDRVIDVMLAVVLGLLGVAVLIALLGVTNTLSLSVIERRRESATLRAIGLTRRRLRGTLAIEGMLIAGVGAVAGGALGVLYGWAGAATVLGRVGAVTLAVPWRDLGLVVLVALAAGLLASVVPARSAVRTPPVAALAEE